MATITTTARSFFKNGASAGSNLVGYTPSDDATYVVRYTFSTADLPAGASSIRVDVPSDLSDDWGLVGTLPTMRYKITTSATSHVGAGPSTTDYDGTAVFTASGGTHYLSIPTDNVILLPNTTYYLYIFSGSSYYGYFYDRQLSLTITASGAAGLVYIRSGSAWEAYQCYVYTGTKWELFLPFVYTGSSWALY